MFKGGRLSTSSRSTVTGSEITPSPNPHARGKQISAQRFTASVLSTIMPVTPHAQDARVSSAFVSTQISN